MGLIFQTCLFMFQFFKAKIFTLKMILTVPSGKKEVRNPRFWTIERYIRGTKGKKNQHSTVKQIHMLAKV